MRLATRNNGTRDGELVVIAPDGARCASAAGICATLQDALDDWPRARLALQALSDSVARGQRPVQPFTPHDLMAPLPRAYEWVDGSAYISHIELVRKARGAEPPSTLKTEPMVYQGGSGSLLGPYADLPLLDEDWGLDFEAEVCVILTDTAQGTHTQDAARHIALVTLANDVTYRKLVPSELAKGFGFFNSKPATAFAPFAVTPDELGEHWHGGRLHAEVRSSLNGWLVGSPNAGPEMHFSFLDLIEHICKTRSFVAGTIVGSGTVSNRDPAAGSSCLAEVRMREVLQSGTAKTPFLRTGDRVQIEVLLNGKRPFGTIFNHIVAAAPPGSRR